MTGAELREFANRLCNDAVVEVQREYGSLWEPLRVNKLRAVITIQSTENDKEEDTLS